MSSNTSKDNISHFESLLSYYNLGGRDEAGSEGRIVRTAGDRKFEATQNVHEVASHLGRAAAELTSCMDTLSNLDEKKTKQKAAVKDVVKSFTPFLLNASKTLTASAKTVAPLHGSQYVHNRISKKRERDVVDTSVRKRPAIQLIDDFNRRFSGEGTPKYPPDTGGISKPATRSTAIPRLPVSIVPPAPRKGTMYDRTEFCEIVTRYPKNSGERKEMFDKVLKASPPLVPHSQSSLYRLLVKFENGEPIVGEAWPEQGRQKIAEDDDMAALVALINTKVGEEWDRDKMNEFLQSKLAERMAKSGFAPTNVPERFSNTTLDNYLSLLGVQRGMSFTKSSSAKTNARFASENSFRMSVSLAVGTSDHFILVANEDSVIRSMLAKSKPDVREFHNLMSEYYGGRAVFPIKPVYILNGDDKSLFICPGMMPGRCTEYRLATTASIKDRDTHAVYNSDGTTNLNGMRVTLYAFVSGGGTSAPPCITVTGMSDYEMPHDDMIVLRIPRLCIGGTVDLACTQEGIVIILKGKKGVQKMRFDFIRDEVVLPYLDSLRWNHDRIKPGDPIPDTSSAVLWMDGDISQIKSVSTSIGAYTSRKVSVNKFGASSTGVQQICDLMKSFLVIEELNKRTTAVHIPPDDCLLKRTLIDELNKLDLEGRLRLRSIKSNALINFLVIVPGI